MSAPDTTRPEPALQVPEVTEVTDTTRVRVGALDGLRASAAIAVIVIHVGIYSGQVASSWLGIPEAGPLGVVISRFTVGVPIFFVLSGLLLYRPWAEAAVHDRPRPATLPYLWHRVVRIGPVYWIVALVALVLFTPALLVDAEALTRILLLLTIYRPDGLPTGIPQTWSLATEVAFYAVLPLLAVALHRVVRARGSARGPRLREGFLLLAGLELVTLLSVAWVHRPAAGDYPLPQLWLPTYLGYFAAGTAVALVAARAGAAPATSRSARLVAGVARHSWWGWAVALVAYVLVSTPITGTTARYPTVREAVIEHLLDLVIAVGLAAPLALAPDRGPARVLSGAPVRFLGRISYGIFLWHMVVVEGWLRLTGGQAGREPFVVLLPVTLAGTVLLAWATYELVEKPARRLRPLVGGRP